MKKYFNFFVGNPGSPTTPPLIIFYFLDELKIYKLNAGKVYFQGKCCLEFIFIFLGA